MTAVQHLLMAATKLRATHARLVGYGEAVGEDPKAIDRIEISMQHLAAARHALTADEPPGDAPDEQLPF